MNKKEGWFGVELRHLAALAAIEREGSFRGAADSLGYVQSAVSQRIVQLERLVGTRLVDRTRGSKEIQPVGKVLVEHAEEILSRVQAARADLTSHADRRKALRVGVFPSVAPACCRASCGRLPRKRPTCESNPPSRPPTPRCPSSSRRARSTSPSPTCRSPRGPSSRARSFGICVLLVSESSDWAERMEPPTLESLAQAPLVVLDGARSSAALEMWFTAQGFAPNVAARAGNEATLRAFVAAGLGVAIVPRLAIEPWDARTQAIGLEGVVPERQIAIFWHRDRVHGDGLEVFRRATIKIAGDLGTRVRPVELAAA
jgi:DNA-binding transcriptional LysR family regulator